MAISRELLAILRTLQTLTEATAENTLAIKALTQRVSTIEKRLNERTNAK
jgi:hypothetical protein